MHPTFRRLSLVCALLAAAACTDTAEPDATAQRCDLALDSAVSAWEDVGFDGVVAVVGGERTCSAGYGAADHDNMTPNTSDTVFSIGSVTKSITAAAILDLIADGVVSADTRAGEVVAELAGPIADATIEQLLLHTSGLSGSLGRDEESLGREAAVDALALLDVNEPGVFAYSNAGYITLALIIDELTSGFRDHLVENVMLTAEGDPLGSFWYGEPAPRGPRAVGVLEDGSAGASGGGEGPHWSLDGAGGIAMTAPDLAEWARALFTGTIPGLDTALLEELRLEQDDGSVEIPGWVVLPETFGEPVYGSSGGGSSIGHEAVVAWLPERGQAIAVITNSADVSAENLLGELLPAWIAGDPLPRPASAGEAELAGFEGRWSVPELGEFSVVADSGNLTVTGAEPAVWPILFPLPDPAAAAKHQADVLDVLAGATSEGATERESLESELGAIESIEVVGTVWVDIEYRTFVELIGQDGTKTAAWVALEGNRSIAALELGTDGPRIRHAPDGEGRSAPVDPVGREAGLGLALTPQGLDIIHPNGPTPARPA